MHKFIYLILFLLLFLSFDALATPSANPSYFQGLWDFIDWIYEGVENIKNAILDFLTEITKLAFLWWLDLKINTAIFIYSIVEPIIDSLNLTDVVTQAFSSLRPDWQAFISQIRLGEGLNILISAKVTKMILNFIGW